MTRKDFLSKLVPLGLTASVFPYEVFTRSVQTPIMNFGFIRPMHENFSIQEKDGKVYITTVINAGKWITRNGKRIIDWTKKTYRKIIDRIEGTWIGGFIIWLFDLFEEYAILWFTNEVAEALGLAWRAKASEGYKERRREEWERKLKEYEESKDCSNESLVGIYNDSSKTRVLSIYSREHSDWLRRKIKPKDKKVWDDSCTYLICIDEDTLPNYYIIGEDGKYPISNLS